MANISISFSMKNTGNIMVKLTINNIQVMQRNRITLFNMIVTLLL